MAFFDFLFKGSQPKKEKTTTPQPQTPPTSAGATSSTSPAARATPPASPAETKAASKPSGTIRLTPKPSPPPPPKPAQPARPSPAPPTPKPVAETTESLPPDLDRLVSTLQQIEELIEATETAERKAAREKNMFPVSLRVADIAKFAPMIFAQGIQIPEDAVAEVYIKDLYSQLSRGRVQTTLHQLLSDVPPQFLRPDAQNLEDKPINVPLPLVVNALDPIELKKRTASVQKDLGVEKIPTLFTPVKTPEVAAKAPAAESKVAAPPTPKAAPKPTAAPKPADTIQPQPQPEPAVAKPAEPVSKPQPQPVAAAPAVTETAAPAATVKPSVEPAVAEKPKVEPTPAVAAAQPTAKPEVVSEKPKLTLRPPGEKVAPAAPAPAAAVRAPSTAPTAPPAKPEAEKLAPQVAESKVTPPVAAPRPAAPVPEPKPVEAAAPAEAKPVPTPVEPTVVAKPASAQPPPPVAKPTPSVQKPVAEPTPLRKPAEVAAAQSQAPVTPVEKEIAKAPSAPPPPPPIAPPTKITDLLRDLAKAPPAAAAPPVPPKPTPAAPPTEKRPPVTAPVTPAAVPPTPVTVEPRAVEAAKPTPVPVAEAKEAPAPAVKPTIPAAPPPIAGTGKIPPLMHRGIDLNTASAEEIASHLEGVGRAMAERIVSDREQNGPFYALYDLARVPGIGSKFFEKITGWRWFEDLYGQLSVVNQVLDKWDGGLPDLGTIVQRFRALTDFDACVIIHRDGHLLATSWDAKASEALEAMGPQIIKRVAQYMKNVCPEELFSVTALLHERAVIISQHEDIIFVGIRSPRALSRRHLQIVQGMAMALGKRFSGLRDAAISEVSSSEGETV